MNKLKMIEGTSLSLLWHTCLLNRTLKEAILATCRVIVVERIRLVCIRDQTVTTLCF